MKMDMVLMVRIMPIFAITMMIFDEHDDVNGDVNGDDNDDVNDVAHRCTIFLCIWDGKYSTGWGPPIGGGRSEMRLQRPKYTKLDLVFCKMSMP